MKRAATISLCIAATGWFSLVGSPAAFAADLVRGKALFEERCTSCHGALGAGDGPVAAALPADQKPRNLQEPARKFATDLAKFKELLKKGGGSVGLNPLMPPQPDLNEADLDSVIAYSESLKKK